MKRIFLLALFCAAINLQAQKPPLDQSVYDSWKSITRQIISDDGNWIAYIIEPQQGDGWLYIFNLLTGRKDSVARGINPSFSANSRYVAYSVKPAYLVTRQAKKKKLKEDQMPKNNLEIRRLPEGETVSIPAVKSFMVPSEKSLWMAYLLEKKPSGKKDDKQKADSLNNVKANQKKSTKTPEPKGAEFVILEPISGKEFRFQDVIEYAVAKNGGSISFIQDIPDTTKIENFKVNVFDTGKEQSRIVFEGKGSAKNIADDPSGKYSAFIYSGDTAKTRIYDLWLSASFNNAVRIVDTTTMAMPSGWSVSENGTITFSNDGTRLFFGTAQKPVKEPEDTLLDEEKYKLDIWSWNDDLLQPMQKKELDQELKRFYRAVYHTDRNIMFQLADTSMPVIRFDLKSSGNYALGTSGKRYRKLISWESRDYQDYFIVNLENGVRQKLLTGYPSQVVLSPGGKFILSWDVDKKEWALRSGTGEILRMLSVPGNFPFYDELNDTPSDPEPYGVAGFTESERQVLLYDRYDIWSFETDRNEAPVNLTNGYGRTNNLRFRYINLDPDVEYIPLKGPLYLSTFNYVNKEAGFYYINLFNRKDPVKLIFEKASFPRLLTKAKNADRVIWQKESFSVSPELFVSDLNFTNIKKLSVTNPQQSSFNWLTAELVEWTSFDKQKLQGILYKPEDFVASKKYPMIVYFYERSSDGFYNYFPPAPSASIINRSFAVSNGYLLFVPDITYRIGYPGESCYNAVMSGTYALLDRYDFIDRERLGLDGQSWGGYQIAWLVTRTDLFKCAYAGAAVSNMISAYGGIRWESGMSRMFQYEHDQSRIGGTIWEKPLQFIENSPVFFVPKINTPLLLMHNDADGAVPWYQGIEFLTALRRLGKPAWMLSYNDEAHNLIKRPNRKDLSIRKMQFFDHYLKGAPIPSWMKYGIPQTEKGKKDGYNLVND
ncbi:MAG: prolyl oligopeptidase family serine peptidase [Bacteroidota bacterium]|nr:prolyl oligopeptidase family serine peptidase [Bacteroidota bacterium]